MQLDTEAVFHYVACSMQLSLFQFERRYHVSRYFFCFCFFQQE